MKRIPTILAAIALMATTADAQRIAVLSDVHVTPGNENDTMLRRAVDEINGGGFDLVVVDGDLTNEGSDEQLFNIKDILDGLKSPLYVLPGNHENNWSQSATKTFVDIWGNDRFVAEHDSLIIIGINCGPYMKMGDGHIKQEDLHWLRSTLDSLVTPGKKVLSFNHYPLRNDLDNWDDYLRVLENYPVIGHINGHYHHWQAYTPGDTTASDLPCVMVRALDMRGGDYGYTEVEIEPEWWKVYNKPIGEKRRPMYAFPVRTSHAKAAAAARPAIVAPEGFSVEKVWADTASIFTRLAFDDKRVFFGNSLGHAKAIAKDGSARWSVPTGASLFARPVVLSNGNVAVPMHDGIMVLDPRTGKLRARRNSVQGPYVADGTLTPDKKGYIQGGYKRMEHRRASDAKTVWVYDSLFNYCQAAPAIDGDDLVFGAWDTNLRCLDLRTGRLRWVWNNGKEANMLGPGNVVPAIVGDKVFIVAPDRYMTAIDRKTGRTIWRDNSVRYRESMGVASDGSAVYAKTMDGELIAVDTRPDTFTPLWKVDLGIGYDHAPCVIVEKDGYIYVGSRRGILSIVDAREPRLIASLPLGVSELNGIDVDPTTGDVYVSLIEGTIFRISRTR